MFKDQSTRLMIADRILRRLSSESPAHHFDIDINIAQGIGIRAVEMDKNIYKLGRQLIEQCAQAKREGVICSHIAREQRIRQPFFHIFPFQPSG